LTFCNAPKAIRKAIAREPTKPQSKKEPLFCKARLNFTTKAAAAAKTSECDIFQKNCSVARIEKLDHSSRCAEENREKKLGADVIQRVGPAAIIEVGKSM
jgi:hypothetical protein